MPVREREKSIEEPTLVELRKEIKDKKKTKTQLKGSMKPLVIKEPPQPSSKEKFKHKKDAPGSSGAEQVSRVKTRSQLSKEKDPARYMFTFPRTHRLSSFTQSRGKHVTSILET